MQSLLYHCIVGNDAPPWLVAACRGLIISGLIAVNTTLGVWQVTDDPKTLAVAGLTTLIGGILARVFGEGTLDTWKERRNSNDTTGD